VEKEFEIKREDSDSSDESISQSYHSEDDFKNSLNERLDEST